MARKETKTCHACRKTLSSDWEVCPFCGASQENFELGAGPAAPRAQPEQLPPGEVIEYEPVENEHNDRPAPRPITVERLRPDSIPTADTLYAVMRLNADRINIPRLGRGLAAILNRPLADITCRIQASKGFLAREVPQARLADVARLTHSLRIEAVAVRECHVAPLPPLYRTAQLTRSDGGLTCAATSPSDKTWKLTFTPEQVRLIVTGRAMYSAKVTVERPLYDPFENISFLKKRYLDPGKATRDVQKEVHGYDYLIFVFLCRPERLLLIASLDIDYDRMERRTGRPQMMALQAQLLVEAVDALLHDDALHLLANLVEEDDPAWLPSTFATVKGFEACAQWRYNISLIEK